MKITLSESQFKELIKNAAQSAILKEDEWDDILANALADDPKAGKALKAAQKDLGIKKKKTPKGVEAPKTNGFDASDEEIIDVMGSEEEPDNEEEKEEKEERTVFGKLTKELSSKLSEEELEKFLNVCRDPYSASFDDLTFTANILKANGGLDKSRQTWGVSRELSTRADVLKDFKDYGTKTYGYKVVNDKVEPTHPVVQTGGASYVPSSSNNM